MLYVGAEDLIANALIESVKKSNKSRVPLSTVAQYSKNVLDIFALNNDKVILVSTAERAVVEFANYFELFSDEDVLTVSLREGVTVNDLWTAFRSYLSMDALAVFENEQAVAVL